MSVNKRKHTRYDNPKGIFNITTDKRTWHEIGLEDISAGGMKFTTTASFDVDEEIELKMIIHLICKVLLEEELTWAVVLMLMLLSFLI